MHAETFTAVWLILMGPVAGSFVAALSDRHCRGFSILRGRSGCVSCGTSIRAFDLIPILSYLLLRGRCRACAAKIGRTTWYAEVAGLGLVVLVVARFPGTAERILGAAFVICLLGLFLADRKCFRLPDALTLPLFGIGLALGTVQSSAGFALTAMAALIGASALWAVGEAYRLARGRVGLGLGDVKMFAGISGAVGLTAAPVVSLVAAVTAIAIEVLRLRGGDRQADGRMIPFGCHLALAGGLVWLAG